MTVRWSGRSDASASATAHDSSVRSASSCAGRVSKADCPTSFGPGLPRAMGVDREIARHREQPRARRAVRQGRRVAPRPHHGLLHEVLRPLCVSTGQMHGIPVKGAAVLGVQRPDKRFVGPAFSAGRCCVRHIR